MQLLWPIWNFFDDIVYGYWQVMNIFALLEKIPFDESIPLGTSIFIGICLLSFIVLVPLGYRFTTNLKYGKVKNLEIFRAVSATLMALMILAALSTIVFLLMLISDSSFSEAIGSGDTPIVAFWGMVTIMLSLGIGLSSWPYIMVKIAQQFVKRSLKNVLLASQILACTLGMSLVYFIWTSITLPTPPEYANVLHAAIKNTCLYDIRQENCPHTLDQIGIVEPANFAKAQQETQMRYEYDPTTNHYVFVMRFNKREGVIFDQRFAEQGGLDVARVEFQTFGKDRIKNPPAFPGPWDNWPGWDKGTKGL